MYQADQNGRRVAFGDRLAVRAPVDLRPRVHEAARLAGIPAAELMRQAIEAHVAHIVNERRQAGASLHMGA